MNEMLQARAPGTVDAAAGRLPPVVVMGVAGCGKSVIGGALAKSLGAAFVEGDRLHPLENVAKMSAGKPLNDADRAGWLDAIGKEVAREAAAGRPVVAACSALKRRYRDALRGHAPALVFLHLAIDRDTAHRRVIERRSHFMPPSLVDSQFADLEPPLGDEVALTLDATRPVAELVAAAAAFLQECAVAGR
jgi:gluconokinase